MITLSVGDVSVEFKHTDLSEIWWLLNGSEARLKRYRPQSPHLAEQMRDIRQRLNTVYQEALRLEREGHGRKNAQGLHQQTP
jgi:hypothetical protein